MSQDGRNWARIEANHHTGALFDAGEKGDWDEILNGAPQVHSKSNWQAIYRNSNVEERVLFNTRL